MTDDAFAGIREKLIRSHENIQNLDSEISRFFEQCNRPVITDEQQKPIPEVVEYYRNLAVPLRFSVLSGEIVHHLRSCLDQVVWLFSRADAPEKESRYFEFPILETRPTKENVPTRYDRKIKGIENPYALYWIKWFQPYRSPDPPNDLLAILHKLDIIDKHRNLVIVATTGAIELPITLADRIARHQAEVSGPLPAQLARDLKPYCKVIPQIAFSESLWGEAETVIHGLTQLQNYVVRVIEEFANIP